jgi:hypothetical protein
MPSAQAKPLKEVDAILWKMRARESERALNAKKEEWVGGGL